MFKKCILISNYFLLRMHDSIYIVYAVDNSMIMNQIIDITDHNYN